MAIEIASIDHYIPSSLTEGRKLVAHSAAQRYGYITGLSGATAAASEAQATAFLNTEANVADAFPDLAHLKHAVSTIKLIDGTRGLFRLDFRRIAGVDTPSKNAWELATKTPGRVGLRYYTLPTIMDGNNRPVGDPFVYTNLGGDSLPRPYIWTAYPTYISMMTVLDCDPTQQLSALRDTVNTVAVTLQGVTDVGNALSSSSSSSGGCAVQTYGANELLYIGSRVIAQETRGATVFTVYHQLAHLDAPGWVEQVIVTPGSVVDNNRIVDTVTGFGNATIYAYTKPSKRADLTGVLPIHTL